MTKCKICSKPLTPTQRRKGQKFCSLACYWANKRGSNPNRHIQVRGTDGKLKYVHRVVYEKFKGKIPDGHVVHHLDGNRHNNDPSNLVTMAADEHTALHDALGDITTTGTTKIWHTGSRDRRTQAERDADEELGIDF